jgi:rhamnose utilization protein RhaD (predicted bifunctional aldolase and dehydrogenase)
MRIDRVVWMLALSLGLFARTASAQLSLVGEWSPVYQEDFDERIPGPALVDFLGLPINAEARQWALSWDPDRLTLPEHQCQVHTAAYIYRGRAATIHVHSVNTIAYAVLADGEQRLEDKLEGLPWAWIPYVASGLPLASEVKKVFAHAPETRILVLANHGLVVCGDDPHSTEDLLMEVEDRLAIEPRRAPKPDYDLLNCVIESSGWKLPQCESSHTLSTDAIARTLFQEGILYPCHAIFLGPAAPLLAADVPLSEGIRHYENDYGMTPRFFLIEGHGVIVSEAMTPAQSEMLRGMAEVAQRIDVDAEIRYLTPQEVSRVLEAEARSYLGETNPVLAGA